MIYPVILCGGSGTRLWPSSRRSYPKQFTGFFGDETLFQVTLKRLTGPDFGAPLVMTNADFRFIATEQCEQIGLADARVVIEPALRNTAPAILAAALLLEEEPDALMLVAPSDHIIAGVDTFLDTVRVAATAAADGKLVTLGVMPDRPETGYGYLELATQPDGLAAHPLVSFTEKPDVATAQTFLDGGKHLWNAGLFLFRVCDITAAYETHAPDMLAPVREAVKTGAEDLGFFRLGEDAYAKAPSDSIDYAVMEKADNIATVPLNSGWSDLGSWDALWSASAPDAQGIVTQGAATAVECENTFLRSEEDSLHLVGVGLSNIVAVAMRDAVLVADMTKSQDVKKAVSLLKEAQIEQAEHYPRFHRPWGWYETLCLGQRFQVKRIMVKPGGILSLQSHVHRSEHWIVVGGTAEVTVGDDKKLLTENESVYIPLGAVHRMANPGRVPMYLIEVQTGTYLGEDDIVRYEDVYNRG
ncbi:mannose-1-phosphate guanylyltransferase/mannose-6-phosphate isomerase [Actibacterium sp. 188UL27-1]|uniref:mannose-1-phosphate guanylyltransferase/mannose-6-phosphate isomerase n=1 Tax=Actibacterium sp. 188UL27-1 TaxID=2786961 RepID=UPI00195BACFD|nr:mannose-1-phosphate guanylyltransferase/mannose-6-phosphate isomerase [Actibacterium sp. 188UL27-1]MBM7068978.1 mannose-1-phosphate guanylyltransferase/mannose-6-phosphate isomerase [Actibacterium sp. 188UL27-1]